MSKKTMREFLLEGLDCANCANKIENKVAAIKGVSSASMNFVTKNLSVEIEETGDLESILKETKEIINKLEPHVIVRERLIDKSSQKALILIGLNCANCAAKIESEVKNLAGIRAASVDFINKKLTIEISDKHEAANIIEEVRKIIKRIEPDVKVAEDGQKEGPNARTFVMEGLG